MFITVFVYRNRVFFVMLEGLCLLLFFCFVRFFVLFCFVFFVYFAYLNICYIVCLFPFSFLSFLFRFHVVQPIPSWVRYLLNVFQL